MRYPPQDEQLSPADASNVEIDAPDQVNSIMLVGLLGCAGFVSVDGAADLDRLRAVLAERFRADPGLRRFSQRVAEEGRHLVWRACEPDMGWHVRQTEPVAGRPGLAAVCARLVTSPLPHDRPLWELLIVPGAGAPPSTAPGIVLRVHHAVADGVAGVHLVQRLFDNPPPAGAERAEAPADQPEPPAPTRRAEPRRGSIRARIRGISRIIGIFRRNVAPTILLGPISQRHGVVLAEVGLDELRCGARAGSGTLNDALLAAAVEAVDATLRAMGEPVPEVLPATVPVALPDRDGSGNAVGVMIVPLPTGIDDPAARISQISAVTKVAKPDARSRGTFEMTRSRWATRLFGALARHQRLVAFFVTNVRGPADPLSLAGAPLEAAWPLTPIQGNVRLGVSAFSYAGRLACTAHLDAAALDQDLFERALEAELDRIVALGQDSGSAPG